MREKNLGSLCFPTTNYKRKDHYRVMLLMSWKYSCLEKICCELRIGDGGGKTVFAWKIASVFWSRVSQCLFKVSNRESYFLVYESKEKKIQIRKAIFNWFFNLKETRNGKLVFALPSGYYACQLVCKWLILKSRIDTQRNTRMQHLCLWSVCLHME